MANYRIKAQKTGPRTFKKELQMISYRGSALFSDEGNTLISEKDVYYPPDFLSKGSVAVVMDTESYEKDGLSKGNKFRKGRPAALAIEEQFPTETEVSRSLLGIDRAETQQGIFDDVSSYGLDRKDWVVYAGWPDYAQGANWEFKNSPAGPHIPVKDFDYAEGSSVVQTSYPVPYYNPGNPPVGNKIRGIVSNPGPGWGRYIQSLVAMYVIEYMVNNFTPQEKERFRLNFLERKYPKTQQGKFNRLYWDQIWLDINQGRFENAGNIPIIPQGTFVNFTPLSGQDTIDIIEKFGSTLPIDDKDVSINFNQFFFATTRYTWIEPDQGHYRIATNPNAEVWQEYWGIDYESLPQALKDWEFGVYESQEQVPAFVTEYKLPYFLIANKNPSQSLIFGQSWPQTFSDPSIPQISGSVADGNLIGARESDYAVITLTSIRAFRYQPGRISGFTYGVRVSEEGAGPGSTLEWGVENYTDGYFFRLKDGTDFCIVRRSTIPLGQTPLFIDAGYAEREAYISQLTGVVKYRDEITTTEVLRLEEQVAEGTQTKVYETLIEQNQMNGDGLNGQGVSGYIYNPDTVTMYKIEFGWYGAIGARFYMYIPQKNGQSRWTTLHTLVIENQLGEPCLEDPFFFFKYRVYVDNPSRIRLPQFVEKYGASYYIDGGDEGTLSIASGKATNRSVPLIASDSIAVPTYSWGTVLGIKPKQFIINTAGNSFNNKKEIFPASVSIYSTQSAEIKFINQFGCRENGFTFQEGYRCRVPETQHLRGKFFVNRLQTNESNLIALGRDINSPTPTLAYSGIDPDYPEASVNLQGVGGQFIGWNAYNNSLHGAHVIAERLYTAYINPTREGLNSSVGSSGPEIILARDADSGVFFGSPRDRSWGNAELLFRYPEEVSIKLSPFRKDTTLLSTVDISSSEFYLLFTRRHNENRDGDRHFSDIQVGVVWPRENPASFTYPQSLISRARVGKNFGVINPKLSSDQAISNDEVEVVEDNGNYYVVDKEVPNSSSYRYYEGLPVDFTDSTLSNNTLLLNEVGSLNVNAQGLEVNEFDGIISGVLGRIDDQLPGVPGEDGGECLAIYGRAGELQQSATWTNLDAFGQTQAGRFYLSSTTSWNPDLWGSANTLFVEDVGTGASIVVTTISGEAQQTFTPAGTAIRLFLLPISIVSGSAFSVDTRVLAKYRAISLYSTSLTRAADRLLAQRIVGQNLFPIRFFVRMRDGAEIGGLTVGQVTANGIVQTPFTPHGCTLSVNNIDGVADRHDGGSGDATTSAVKSMIAFNHPGSLIAPVSYSYYDVSSTTPMARDKKCPSFISADLLSGAGFSGTGDYPIRWLEFKESGDPVASYFISANTPTEIDLSDVFNINTESVGPSFWANKALFMIARNISAGAAGKMNVTFNYKEQ
jgi:hypothetical protein